MERLLEQPPNGSLLQLKTSSKTQVRQFGRLSLQAGSGHIYKREYMPGEHIKTFFQSRRGSAAIEMALITPVIALLAWGGWTAVDAWRVQNALNRQSAWLAEMFANLTELSQPAEGELPKINPISSQIPGLMGTANNILKKAVGDENATTGLRVSYVKSGVVDGALTATETGSWSIGTTCGSVAGTVPLTEQVALLATAAFSSRIVRVEACLDNAERSLWNKTLGPENYITSFTTVRKNDDAE